MDVVNLIYLKLLDGLCERHHQKLKIWGYGHVIFNGTQNLPAKNFAEVSIELDDFKGDIQNIPTNSHYFKNARKRCWIVL